MRYLLYLHQGHGPVCPLSYQVRHMIQMWLDNLRSGGSLKVTGYNDHGNVVLYALMLRRIQGECLNYCHHPSLLLGICTYVNRSSNLLIILNLNLNHLPKPKLLLGLLLWYNAGELYRSGCRQQAGKCEHDYAINRSRYYACWYAGHHKKRSLFATKAAFFLHSSKLWLCLTMRICFCYVVTHLWS